MTLLSVVLKTVDVGFAIAQRVQAYRDARRAKQRAAAWANAPAPVRACPACHEVSYLPPSVGQLRCLKCGAAMKPLKAPAPATFTKAT